MLHVKLKCIGQMAELIEAQRELSDSLFLMFSRERERAKKVLAKLFDNLLLFLKQFLFLPISFQ